MSSKCKLRDKMNMHLGTLYRTPSPPSLPWTRPFIQRAVVTPPTALIIQLGWLANFYVTVISMHNVATRVRRDVEYNTAISIGQWPSDVQMVSACSSHRSVHLAYY